MAAVKSFVGKLQEKLVDTLFSDENYLQEQVKIVYEAWFWVLNHKNGL